MSDGDIADKIAATIREKRVVVYMKGSPMMPQCGFSAKTLETLKAAGLKPADLKTVNVLQDDKIRQGIKDYTGWPTVPQVFIDGEFIGGCDIVTELFAKGELAEKLK